MAPITLFFFLSGFCALLYQTVWLRLMMAGFGVNAPVISSVLSVFMLGLALGSYLGGKWAERLQTIRFFRGLRAYALVELIIGVGGLTVPGLITTGRMALLAFPTTNSAVYLFLSFLVILVTLLPFCTAMGATYPLALAFLQRQPSLKKNRLFSHLYLVNVIGSIFGTFLTACFLIEILGFHSTMKVAIGINLLIFLVGFLYPGPNEAAIFSTAQGSPQPERNPAQTTPPVRDHGFTLFLLGFCSLGIEVVWARLYTPYIGQEVYAFASMLCVYLAFTALGTVVYRGWFPPENEDSLRKFWFAAGPAAAMALLSCHPDFSIFGFGRVFLGVGPISFITGILTPFLIDSTTKSDAGGVGKAYAANLLGCIAGPLIAGFFLIPLFGNRVAGFLFALGFWFAAWPGLKTHGTFRETFKPATIALFMIGLAFCCAVFFFGKTFEMRFPESQVKHDYMATVVATGSGLQRELLVNGMGMTYLTTCTKVMAHFPLASLSHTPERGLIICLGMGTTFRSMMKWGIDTTVVELTPSVADFLPYFYPDIGEMIAGRNGLARVIIDDGRRFLDRGTELYDVITIDPPPPITAAASGLLYSIEFYRSAKRRLKQGGILQTWIPGGDPKVLAAVSGALLESFPHVRQFLGLEGWGYHFTASMEPIPLRSAEDLAGRMNEDARADLIELIQIPPVQILQTLLKNEVDPRKFLDTLSVRHRLPMCDDRPINEYFLLRTLILVAMQFFW